MGAYDIAQLTGGPQRVLLAAIVSLTERRSIRITNPLATEALDRIRRAGRANLGYSNMHEVRAIGADRRFVEATVVSAGDVPPAGSVEAETAEMLRAQGVHRLDELSKGPAYRAVRTRLAARHIRLRPHPQFTPQPWQGWWQRRKLPSDPAVELTRAEVRRRMHASGLEDVTLTTRITGSRERLPVGAVNAVSLIGELPLWVADPALAVALGELAAFSFDETIVAFS